MCRMSHTDMVCLSGQGVVILRDAVGFFERYKKHLQAMRVDTGS